MLSSATRRRYGGARSAAASFLVTVVLPEPCGPLSATTIGLGDGGGGKRGGDRNRRMCERRDVVVDIFLRHQF